MAVPGQVVPVRDGLEQDHGGVVAQPGHHGARQLLGDPGRVQQVADPRAELVEQREPAARVLDLGHRPVALRHVHHRAGDAEHLARPVGHPAVRDRPEAAARRHRRGQRHVDDGLAGRQHLALDRGDLVGGALRQGLAGRPADVVVDGDAVHVGERPVDGGVAQVGVQHGDAQRGLLEQGVAHREIALDRLDRAGLREGHLQERGAVAVHQQRDPGLHRDALPVPVAELGHPVPAAAAQGLPDGLPGPRDLALVVQQLVDPAAHQQLARPAEQLLGGRAPQHHPGGRVQDRDGHLHHVEQAALGVPAEPLTGGRRTGERHRRPAPGARRRRAGGHDRKRQPGARVGLAPPGADAAGAGTAAQPRTGRGAARGAAQAGGGRAARPASGKALGALLPLAVTRTRHRRGLRLSGHAPRRGAGARNVVAVPWSRPAPPDRPAHRW